MRMETERLLTGLFDLQRFERDPALQKILDEVEAQYFSKELSDDTMHVFSAAGDPFLQPPDPKNRGGPL